MQTWILPNVGKNHNIPELYKTAPKEDHNIQVFFPLLSFWCLLQKLAQNQRKPAFPAYLNNWAKPPRPASRLVFNMNN